MLTWSTFQSHLRAAATLVAFTCPWVGAISLSGCVQEKNDIPGVKNFVSGVINDYFYLSFLAPDVHVDVGLSMPIPGLEGATASIGPDLQSDGMLFQFSAPLTALAQHGGFYPMSGLPDGRLLPDVNGGQLPRYDDEVGQVPLSLYLSSDTFGLFIPIYVDFESHTPIPWIVETTIHDDRGNLLGKVYLIPSNTSGKGSGLFILLPDLGVGVGAPGQRG